MAQKFRWIGKSQDGNQVILNRFQGEFHFMQGKPRDWLTAHKPRLGRAIVLDVETTGLSSSEDAIIEIAAHEIFYDKTKGVIEWVGESFHGLQDPGRPIPEEITKLTGITDADVKGMAIDWGALAKFIDGANLIIAHNAAFDRPFVEQKLSAAKNIPWACSLTQVDWAQYGFPMKKLEVLAIYHGFFSEAHRALGDVDTLIHLLSFSPAEGKPTYLAELLTNARKPLVHMAAANSPFESKDHLKRRGYSWDAERRVWFKKFPKELLDEEIQWLEAKVYNGNFRGNYKDVPLERNFSLN